MTECTNCRAPAGYWIVRKRLDPLNSDQFICLGVVDPGPEWWAYVRKWFDVSDAPIPRYWIPPELTRLDATTAAGPLCRFCAPKETPSLFDEGEADAVS